MSRRLLKAAEAIREVVATSILTDLRDPRIQGVTVVGVEVTPDMREAKVSVTVMGDEKQERLSIRGLQHSAGFLQSKIAKRIETRYVPKLQFVIDRGAENAIQVARILEKIRREKEGLPPLPDPLPDQDGSDHVAGENEDFDYDPEDDGLNDLESTTD